MAIPYSNILNSSGRSLVDSINSSASLARKEATNAISSNKAGYEDLKTYGTEGIASIKAGLDTLQNTGNQGLSTIRSSIDGIVSANPSASINLAKNSASEMRTLANDVASRAGTVSGLGSQMTDISNQLSNLGNSYSGIASDLLNMNRDSEYDAVSSLLGLYDQYDPNRYASLAGQDVDNAYNVGTGSMNRSLSRQGVNPSSGRYTALQEQYQVARNTAKAAAITRARQLGLNEQSSAFQSLIAGNAKDFANMGKDSLATSANVLGNAVGAEQTAAGLSSNAASIWGSAAATELSAVNTQLGYEQDLANRRSDLGKTEIAVGSSIASQQNTLGNAMMNLGTSLSNQQNTIATSQKYYSSLLDDQSARELGFLQNDLNNLSRQIMNAQNGSYNVYEDFSGNRTFVGNGGNNVTVVNKTNNGYQKG